VGAVVLDASVVIGLVHVADAHHDRSVEAVGERHLRGDHFVLPTSVLAESLVGTYRAGADAGDDLCSELLAAFGPERAPDAQVARVCAQLLARRPSLRLPDALVIATGIVDDAEVLTCDQRLASIDDRVRVLSAE
jgi:predicted nucleic acid-binding protein